MTDEEIRVQVNEIVAVFEVKIRHHRFFERLWSNCTSGLNIVAVACSVAALFVGFLTKLPGEIVGVIGAVPAAVALVHSQLQCNQSVQWHDDFTRALEEVLNQSKLKDGKERLEYLVNRLTEIDRVQAGSRKAMRSKFVPGQAN